MRAVVVEQKESGPLLRVTDVPAPSMGTGDVRIRVSGAGVNRADLLQARGLYPPPPGASEILGLECAGTVVDVGREVRGVAKGTRVMALLAGGGYAEEVVVDAGSVLPVPDGLTDDEAAAFPEVFLTVFANVFEEGGLRAGDWVLVHGGGSGIGTAATRLAKAAGARILVTAGSEAKVRRCEGLGADRAVNYNADDFVAAAKEVTEGRGVDVVLDPIGAPYLERNLRALAASGRLLLIGVMGGSRAEIDLAKLLVKRQRVIGSTLRTRSSAEKASLVAAFRARFDEDLSAGRLTPVVDRVLTLEEAGEAHRVMKASEHFGKLVLRVDA